MESGYNFHDPTDPVIPLSLIHSLSPHSLPSTFILHAAIAYKKLQLETRNEKGLISNWLCLHRHRFNTLLLRLLIRPKSMNTSYLYYNNKKTNVHLFHLISINHQCNLILMYCRWPRGVTRCKRTNYIYLIWPYNTILFMYICKLY